MDDQVHEFTVEAVPPLSNHKRDEPYANNGVSPKAFKGSAAQKHHKHHHKKHPDVAERDMDEEVHGFAAANVSGINEIAHANSAPAMNGGSNMLAKKSKVRDIAERGMDEEVHGFAAEATSGINV